MKERITRFIEDNLDPAGRLGEMLFALIMALGFTAAVRLGMEEPNNRDLFLGILGCNVAWAIVDGAMYILGELFERGRRARLYRLVLEAKSEEQAMRYLASEFNDRLSPFTTKTEQTKAYEWILEVLRRGRPVEARLKRVDIFGGLAAALVIVLATIPVVIPYLVFLDPTRAVRWSHGIALISLFLLGRWWGREVGASPWRVGLGLTLLGFILVMITVALGG